MASRDWTLWACGEFCGVDPDGKVRKVDQSDDQWCVAAGGRVELTSPRNGWVSLRVVVAGSGEFALSANVDGCEVDLFREVFHKLAGKNEWHPDALVPIGSSTLLTIPAADFAPPKQKAQPVWVDIFVPRGAAVGPHTGKVTLKAAGQTQTIDLVVDVAETVYPDSDCVQMDYNSYGATFMEKYYADALPAKPGAKRDAAILKLIHKYHALVFEHRGLYHQLGFGHSGQVGRLFGPKLSGDGRDRHVSDWSLYDQHYGPLLDGSAFEGGRRKPEPIYSIYTPITPDWPADWLGFGQPGYRVEMVNVLRDFDQHFREKGWTKTIPEYFFNHKKRYRYFEWDGDEPRYERDDYRFRQYREFLDEAVDGSPVPWRFRIDASWMMHEHFKTLAGVTDFWVCGGFVSAWEKQVHEGPIARGDVVWWYNGAPTIDMASSDVNQLVYKTWFRDFTGNCIWLTTNVGKDPWTENDGCATGLVYPGMRFGIAGPIPSVRMKVMRNAMQDVNLLQALVESGLDKEKVKKDVCPQVPIKLWWSDPPRAMLEEPPMEWTGAKLARPVEPDEQRFAPTGATWWQTIRDYARTKAQEVTRG